MTHLKMAFKNLGRNRRRNLATASAIVLGYAGLIVLSGFVNRIEKFFRATSVYLNHVGTLSVYKTDGVERHLQKPKDFNLSKSEVERITAVAQRIFPVNDGVTATLEGFSLIGNGCKTWPVKIKGIDTQLDQRLTSHPSVQTYAAKILNARRGEALGTFTGITPILITDKVARALGKTHIKLTSDTLGATGSQTPLWQNLVYDCDDPRFVRQLEQDSNVQLAARTYQNAFSAIDAEVVGFYTSGLELLEESAALVPLQALKQLYETEGATSVVIYLPWGSDEQKAERQLAAALKSEQLDVEVHNYKKFSVNPFYAGFMNLIYVMSAFFLTLAIGIVTLTVTDTMTMSVLERTREIGTLRALGFKRKQIINLFTLEGSLLACLCLPVGYAFAMVAAFLINSSNFLFEVPGISTKIQVLLEISPFICVVIGFALVMVTSLAGWFTSKRSSGKSVAGLLNTHVS